MSTWLGVICDCGKICYEGDFATRPECEICNSCLNCCNKEDHDDEN